jgi:hypothetical protein
MIQFHKKFKFSCLNPKLKNWGQSLLVSSLVKILYHFMALYVCSITASSLYFLFYWNFFKSSVKHVLGDYGCFTVSLGVSA